jgi:hypothetical protein
MDLSKYTLEECLDFIEKEGYTIKQCNYGKENTYTLLYICDVMDTKLAIQYNQYYECSIAKFDSFDELEIQLNVWDHGSNAIAIGIFHQNTNITKEYNINNFNTYLDKGNKLTDEYKTKYNICYKCEKNKSIFSCDLCSKYKICKECINLKLFKYCICGCKLRTCPNCLKNKFTKCCDHNDNYLYYKHKLLINDCHQCIHNKIYELSKLELTEISKSYLMEFIARQIDLLNDQETEENKDMLKKLEEIYESKLRIYSYCIYKDSEINKTDLYILTGYILDKNLSKNDLFVKKIILNELIKYHNDYYNILSLEELKKLNN